MNNNWLKYLVAIAAILIAGTAAYFSVTGLGVLFSGAAVAVMVMAGSLEFAKLVSATYLKQKWDTLKGFNKWYLAFAVVVLMLITSAGIFGYLSNAFQQQNLKLNQVEREISVWENKIKGNNDQIATITTQLNGLQSNQGTILEKGKVNSRLLRSVDNRDKQVNKLTDKINVLQDSIIAYNGKINEIKNNNIEIEREVGGFRFVADAFGVDLNSVVKFFIILIVIVFDPLAIALVIAFNQLVMVKKKDEDETPSNPEDLKDFVDETTRIHLSENDLKKLEEVLLNPPFPNEKLKAAAQRYSDEVREKHNPIKGFKHDEEKNRTEEILSEMMKNDQELGLYDEPFDNPMIKKEVVPALSDEEIKEMFMDEWERKFNMVEDEESSTIEPTEEEENEIEERLRKMDEELKLQEEEYDDDISDWDSTLMDGLEDEGNDWGDLTNEDLIGDDEIISTIEPTEEEESQNFSTIEPISENIFQDNEEFIIPVDESIDNEPELTFSDEFLSEAIEEFNQESLMDEPIYQSETKEIDQMLEIVNNVIDEEIKEPQTLPEESDEKKKY